MTDSLQKRGKALEEDYFDKQNKAMLEKLRKSKANNADATGEPADKTNPVAENKKAAND